MTPEVPGFELGLELEHLVPPDLFVSELTRPTIEAIVADLIRRDALPPAEPDDDEDGDHAVARAGPDA